MTNLIIFDTILNRRYQFFERCEMAKKTTNTAPVESSDQKLLWFLLNLVFTIAKWFFECLALYIFVTFMLTGKLIEQDVDINRFEYSFFFLVCFRIIQVIFATLIRLL